MLITKDGVTLNVSKGAFIASFQTQGWVKGEGTEMKVANNPTQMSPKPTKVHKKTKESEAPFQELFEDAKIDDLSQMDSANDKLIGNDEKTAETEEILPDNAVEIPISEMTVNELIDFADEHDIDISGIQGKSNIRAAIEASLQ